MTAPRQSLRPAGEPGAEAQRQQGLLRVLWRQADAADLAGWLRESPARGARGIAAYRANAQALAARALEAAYPTVAALVGDEAFAAIAALHWLRQPPRRGDLAQFGGALPDALVAEAQLADLPYLGDVARLDWAVHGCAAAADDEAPVEGLALLGDADPARIGLQLRAGLSLVVSRWPVATIWQAHRSGDADRFAPARAALARGDAEAAIVWRNGWRAEVQLMAPADARFTAALLAPHTLASALDAAGAEFEFEPWLLRALRQGWLRAVAVVATDGAMA